MSKHPFFFFLTAVLVLVTAVHILGMYLYWYWRIPWLDLIAHFGGGVWAGGMSLLFFYEFKRRKMASLPGVFMSAIFVFASVVVIGVAWELFEIAIRSVSLAEPGYWQDTIVDLIADTTGALTAVWYFFVRRYNTGVGVLPHENS
ncbi:MAG: hypothetical protein AAB727_02255 [Patescibacteria group bacterium]